MKEDLTLTIKINEKISDVLKERYEEYLAEAKEPVLSVEEFNLHIFKIGILSNEIRIKENELSSKKAEVGNLNSEIWNLKEEYHNNRDKLNYSRY